MEHQKGEIPEEIEDWTEREGEVIFAKSMNCSQYGYNLAIAMYRKLTETKGKHFGPEDTESLIQSIFVTLTQNVRDYNTDRLFTTAQSIGYQWAGMMDAVYEGAAQWEEKYNDLLKQTKASPEAYLLLRALIKADAAVSHIYDQGIMAGSAFIQAEHDCMMAKEAAIKFLKDTPSPINLPSNENAEIK